MLRVFLPVTIVLLDVAIVIAQVLFCIIPLVGVAAATVYTMLVLLLVLCCVWAAIEIKPWLDPDIRVMKRSEAKRKREDIEWSKGALRELRQNPCLYDFYVNPAQRRTSANFGHPRTWQRWVHVRLTWMVNHHVLLESVYVRLVIWLGRKVIYA